VAADVAGLVTEASGTRVVPEPPELVWQALAVLRPYCAVCDVSYVVSGAGEGTTFVCVPGRLDGADPPPTAVRGAVVEWTPPRVVETRLDRGDEVWTTRVQLTGIPDGGTQVRLDLRREASGGGRLAQAVQRRAAQRLVRRTVDAELERLPEHIAGSEG
jgi:hypothetical protein